MQANEAINQELVLLAWERKSILQSFDARLVKRFRVFVRGVNEQDTLTDT